MQKLYSRFLHEQVVVVLRAAHEVREALHRVADLEADAFGEELVAGVDIERAEHDVTELPRPRSHRRVVCTQPRRAPLAVDAPRAVVLRRGRRLLHKRRRDLHAHGDARTLVERAYTRRRALARDAQRVQPRRHASDVVGIFRADRYFDQPPDRCVRQPQLLAAVGRREDAGPRLVKAEVSVKRGRRRDIGHPDGNRVHAVQCHDGPPGRAATITTCGCLPLASTRRMGRRASLLSKTAPSPGTLCFGRRRHSCQQPQSRRRSWRATGW